MKRIKRYVKRLINVIRKPELRILPGQIAFFIVLSAVPLIALIGCICSLFSISLDGVLSMFTGTVPEAVSNILLQAFNNPGFTAGFSIIVGFVVASNGTNSIIIASNLLFKIDNKDYLKRRIKAFFMIFILITLFFFIVVVLGFGNVILKTILSLEFLVNIADYIYTIFILLKWPIAIVLIFFMVKLLYTMAIDIEIKSKYMNKGAVFTTIGWILVTAIYSYYASNFAHYDMFYGSLANLVVLMIWVYILSYILVIGIAINSDDYNVEKSVSNKNEWMGNIISEYISVTSMYLLQTTISTDVVLLWTNKY